MYNIYVICRRELLAIFSSAIAWVFLTTFLLLNGAIFTMLVSVANSPGGGSYGEIFSWFFGGTIFYWLFVLILIPLITMRLLSEEKRTGTLETLLTAPVNDTEVVLGKFAAALTFYISLWLPSLFYVGIMNIFGDVDWGPIASSYLGLLLVGAALTSVGVLTSALTRNQIISAVLCFMILLMFFVVGILEFVFNDANSQVVFRYLNLWNHISDFSRGIVDTRPIVYDLSITVISLFLAVRVLGWRHRG